MTLLQTVRDYRPWNEAEAADKASFIQFLETFGENVYTRDNFVGHVTVACFIVNKDKTKALAAFHNIMQHYAWLGGHADGERNLAAVALKEIEEESGLKNVRFVQREPIDINVLVVFPHLKHGKNVAAHLHYNLAYLLQADEQDEIRIKADENSDIKWVSFDELLKLTDAHSAKVYQRIIEKLKYVEAGK